MSLPKDLLYTEEHEWVKADEGSYVIGITDFAQDQLGISYLLNCQRLATL